MFLAILHFANLNFLGAQTFTENTSIILTQTKYGTVSWVDYDNDEDLDIFLTGNTSNYVNIPVSKIYRNNGDATFTFQTDILPKMSYSSAAWGDYDNDGDLDLLMTGLDINSIPLTKIFQNNNNETFSEISGISLTGVENGSSAWSDFANDGD